MPLKRVNQTYVIATSTKVDVSSVDVTKFEDAYFKATEKKTVKKGESDFFETETEKKVSLCTGVNAHYTELDTLGLFAE